MTIHSENQQQTLSVLLSQLYPSWISLLEAEGIEWTGIDADNCTDAFEEFSVLIIPKGTPKNGSKTFLCISIKGNGNNMGTRM